MTADYWHRYDAWPGLPLFVRARERGVTPQPCRAARRRVVDDLVAGSPAVYGALGSAATSALGHAGAAWVLQSLFSQPMLRHKPPGGVLQPPGGWLMDRSRFT